MSDTQTWTIVGIFATTMLGMVSVTWGLLFVIRNEITGLRGEVTGLRREATGEVTSLRTEMNQRFDTLQAALAGLGERVARLEVKVDTLDKDVAALAKRWGERDL